MDKKKLVNVLCILIGIGVVAIIGILIYKHSVETIPDDYRAVFYGEKGNDKFETYIYDLKDDKENYNYKYVDTKNGKITKKGRANMVEDIMNIINDNGSTGYVMEDDKKYSVDDYLDLLRGNPINQTTEDKNETK